MLHNVELSHSDIFHEIKSLKSSYVQLYFCFSKAATQPQPFTTKSRDYIHMIFILIAHSSLE